MSFESFRHALHQVCFDDEAMRRLSIGDLMRAIPRIDSLPAAPAGTRVLVRAELDVPIADGKIADDTRLRACLPTIDFCRQRGWQVILVGHIGRRPTISLAPVSEALQDIIGARVDFVEDWVDAETWSVTEAASEVVRTAQPGTVVLLENARKYDFECSLWHVDEAEFARLAPRLHHLAVNVSQTLAEIEVNEAIAASNRDATSSVFPLCMKATGLGFFIHEELAAHVRSALDADVVVFSGLKSGKLDDLEVIMARDRVRQLFAGGALAMALVKADARLANRDVSIGRVETDEADPGYVSTARVAQAEHILRMCRLRDVAVHLPSDFILDDGSVTRDIPADRVQFDIGPATRSMYRAALHRYGANAREDHTDGVLFMNGVMGMVEDERYTEGTKSIVEAVCDLTEDGVRTYVGGGDARAALLRFGREKGVTHSFTAGGTILKLMAGQPIGYLSSMYLQNHLPHGSGQ
jgi:phosphoglycerate kinase